MKLVTIIGYLLAAIAAFLLFTGYSDNRLAKLPESASSSTRDEEISLNREQLITEIETLDQQISLASTQADGLQKEVAHLERLSSDQTALYQEIYTEVREEYIAARPMMATDIKLSNNPREYDYSRAKQFASQQYLSILVKQGLSQSRINEILDALAQADVERQKIFDQLQAGEISKKEEERLREEHSPDSILTAMLSESEYKRTKELAEERDLRMDRDNFREQIAKLSPSLPSEIKKMVMDIYFEMLAKTKLPESGDKEDFSRFTDRKIAAIGPSLVKLHDQADNKYINEIDHFFRLYEERLLQTDAMVRGLLNSRQ